MITIKNNGRSFIKGAFLLSAAGIICKLIGAFYRVPLSNILGTEGMGVYQMAYPVYSALITFSTAGVPVAVSSMVSEKLADNDEQGAADIFRVSKISLLAVGVLCSLILFFGADMIAGWMGLEKTALSLKLMAPSLVFVAVCSGYRGYMQGRMLMGATAASQLAEQVVRAAAGIGFAVLFITMGSEYGSAGAMLGLTLSEIIGFTVMALMTKKHARLKGRGDIALLIKIYKIALPVTLGAMAVSLVGAIDSAMIMRILQETGMAEGEAASQYGLLTGFVSPVVNMPAVLTGAMAVSIVPAVAGAKGGKTLSARAGAGFRLAMSVSLPCAVGLFVLAQPVMSLLYPSLTGAELSHAVDLLRLLCPCVVLLGVTQVSAGVLQGMKRTVLPVLTMMLGAMLKIFMGLALIRIPSLGIGGAAIGTLLCFGFTAAADAILLIKYADIHIDAKLAFIKPAICSFAMGVVVYIVNGYIKGGVGTVIALLAGVAVYVIMLIMTKGLGEEESKLLRPIKRLRIFRR